jgi:hypothetical protein
VTGLFQRIKVQYVLNQSVESRNSSPTCHSELTVLPHAFHADNSVLMVEADTSKTKPTNANDAAILIPDPLGLPRDTPAEVR